MPNGTGFTPAEFEFLHRPLVKVDAVIGAFAEAVNGHIEHNYHNLPSRQITVRQEDGLEKTISLSVITSGGGASRLTPHYGVFIWAGRDTDQTRTTWSHSLERLSVDQMTPDIVERVLREAWEKLVPVDDAFLRYHGSTMSWPHGRRDVS